MQLLDPLHIPVLRNGHFLIEASAGTGKTFTLGLLYLRLLLERRLPVDNILVVTFTRTATEELRCRIRTLLGQSCRALQGRDDLPKEPVATLLRQADAGTLELLTDALIRLDCCAITTIHGFCQRMLSEHAQGYGMTPGCTILADEHDLRLEIIEDFWRTAFYPCDPAESRWLLHTFTSPPHLLALLEKGLLRPGAQVVPVIDPDEVDDLREKTRALFQVVKHQWHRDRNTVMPLLREDPALRRNGTTYRRDRLDILAAEMEGLFREAPLPWLLPRVVRLLSASVMQSCCKKGKAAPQHPFFQCFAEFLDHHDQLTSLRKIQIIQEGRAFVLERLRQRKAEHELLSYDDLLLHLYQALTSPPGQQVAARIRHQFTVALIDEFQDTDPLQYEIFRAIYPSGQGTLYLIGDPKQAIYAFRGGDVFTYERARNNTPPAHRFTMTTNYRSTTAMVEAVNTLFEGKHAFIPGNPAPFVPVQAAGLADAQALCLHGKTAASLQALLLEDHEQRLTIESATRLAARQCGHQVALLLAQGKKGQAILGERPLKGGDIGILVRTNQQGRLIQQVLSRLGIAAVSLGQESVFSTPEAENLRLLLDSLLHPDDEGFLRTLLVTPLFGLDATRLEELGQDQDHWHRLAATLDHYGTICREQGFFPMFQNLADEQHLSRRLSAQINGERQLTNYLHLAELLQDRFRDNPHLSSLRRWLDRNIRRGRTSDEHALLRLESDANLVQIITVHKAKGLQYPVVLLPFLWQGRDRRHMAPPLQLHHPDTLEFSVDLAGEDPLLQHRAREEEWAEDLRLLYVALTRSTTSCYFCWGWVNKMEHAPMSRLLHGKQTKLNATRIMADLHRLEKQGVLRIKPQATSLSSRLDSDRSHRQVPAVKSFTATIPSSWSITSYSRLTTDQARSATFRDGDANISREAGGDRFTFPAGPSGGTLLHTILESIDFARPIREQESLVREQLVGSGQPASWSDALVSWLQQVVDTSLTPSLRLRDLPADDQVREMGFYFSVTGWDADRFNQILARAHIAPVAGSRYERPELLKGFIDLVFCWQGTFFVVDYKSNLLGSRLDDYLENNLEQAMRQHHYDLQALIYLLALHRFLGQRLEDYDPERHLGGYWYLFVRGMHPQGPAGCGIWHQRPSSRLIVALDRCFQGGG